MSDDPKIYMNHQETTERLREITREIEQRHEAARQREYEVNRQDRINSIWTVDELVDVAKTFDARIRRRGKHIVIIVEAE